MTDHPGNPNAAQAPSPAPGPGIIPVAAIPDDTTDDVNTASVAQAMKVPVDFLAHHAFPGRVGLFRERWDIAAATLTNANAGVIADLGKRWEWFISAGASQTAAFQDPTTPTGSYSGKAVKLDQGTGNAAQLSGLFTAFPVWTPPVSPYRFLFEVDIQPTLSTLNSREWHIGLSGAGGTTDVQFYSDYQLANWQGSTGGNFTDTGVPVSVGNTWFNLAFLVDTTLPVPAVLYFINGALVATRTTFLPTAGTAYKLMLAGRQVLTGTCAFTAGELVASWAPKF